jgi:hypothetical protein
MDRAQGNQCVSAQLSAFFRVVTERSNMLIVIMLTFRDLSSSW